jgi:hypothetical protein
MRYLSCTLRFREATIFLIECSSENQKMLNIRASLSELHEIELKSK